MLLNRAGYTLMQTLLLLIIVSIVLLLLPMHRMGSYTSKYEIQKLRDVLLNEQKEAVSLKERKEVSIEDDKILIGNREIDRLQNLRCGKHFISFNERGNVNQARTITCSDGVKQEQLIINLGSGNMYVK